jgi:putative ABC transport system permease protein
MITLVWRYLKQQRKRTILTICGVLLATALVSSVGIFLTSFQNMMMTDAMVNTGDYDYWVGPESQEAPLSKEDCDRIASNFLVKGSGLIVFDEWIEFSVGDESHIVELEQREQSTLAMRQYEMIKGRMPQNEAEIALDTSLYRALGGDVQVGDTISGTVMHYREWLDDGETRSSKEPLGSGTFTVVGLYDDYARKFIAGGVLPQIPHRSYGMQLYIKDGMNKSEAMQIILEDTGVEASAHMNGDYLQWQGQRGTNQMQHAIVTTFLILAGIILVAMVTVIRNAFAMSVSEKMSQFGSLRCVGASPSQIRSMVFGEAVIIWLIAIPLGFLLGIAAMAVVFAVVQRLDVEMLRHLKLVVSPLPFLVTAGLSLIAVILSAWAPAFRASRITAIDAVRGKSVFTGEEIHRVHGRGAVGWLFGLPGELAAKNIRRNKKRYRTTVLSVTLSITLFICLGGFGSSVLGSIDTYSGVRGADFLIAGYDPENRELADLERISNTLMASGGMEKSFYARYVNLSCYTPLSKLTEEFRTLKSEYGQDPEENAEVPGLLLQEESFYRLNVTAFIVNRGEYENLTQGKSVIGYDELVSSNGVLLCGDYIFASLDHGLRQGKSLSYQPGEQLPLVGYYSDTETLSQEPLGFTLRVAGLLDERPWFAKNVDACIFLPAENAGLVLQYQGELAAGAVLDDVTSELSLKAKAGSEEAMSKLAEETAGEYSGEKNVYLNNLYEAQKQDRNTAVVMGIFIYGFLTVVIVICSLNLFNTINANLQMRKREIAMQRAVGMGNAQLWRMLLLECLLYGVIGTLWGAVAGIALQKLLLYSLSGAMQAAMLNPLKYILLSLAGAILVSLVAGVGPIRAVIRRPIVEEIRAQE